MLAALVMSSPGRAQSRVEDDDVICLGSQDNGLAGDWVPRCYLQVGADGHVALSSGATHVVAQLEPGRLDAIVAALEAIADPGECPDPIYVDGITYFVVARTPTRDGWVWLVSPHTGEAHTPECSTWAQAVREVAALAKPAIQSALDAEAR